MLTRIVLFSALGGLLFGYDLSLIGPALPHIAADLGIGGSSGSSSSGGTLALELIVGASKAGAFFGAFLGGATMLRYGRRVASAVNGAFFTLGPLIQAFASGGAALALGRLVAGVGIGASAIVVPAYLAEVAPAARRGAVVQTYELAIAMGTLLAVGADAAVAAAFGGWGGGGGGGGGSSSGGGVPAWRWMLGLPAVGGVAVAAGLLVLPESPRWLVLRGKLDEALAVLRRILSASSASGVGGRVGGRRAKFGDPSYEQEEQDAARLAEAEDELLLLWSAVEKDKAAVLARREAVLRARAASRGEGEGGEEEERGQAGGGGPSTLRQPSQSQQHQTRSGRLLDAWAASSDPASNLAPAASSSGLVSFQDRLRPPGGGGDDGPSSPRDAAASSPRPPPPPPPPAHAPNPSPAPTPPGQERTFLHTLAHVVADVAAVARGPEGHALAVAGALAVFNQACASTAVINYAPAVLRREGLLMAASGGAAGGAAGGAGGESSLLPPPPPGDSGADLSSSVLYPAAMAAAKVAGVAASLFLVDRVGRRPLLVAGGAAEAAALLVAAAGLAARSAAGFMAGVCLFLLAFSLSWAGLYWVVVSELFSMTSKSPATAAAAALLFASGTVADLAFLSAVDALGGWALVLCALVAASGALYVYFELPETRGVPLAEVQAGMAARGAAERARRERRRAAAAARGGAVGRVARCLPSLFWSCLCCCCWPAGAGGQVTALPSGVAGEEEEGRGGGGGGGRDHGDAEAAAAGGGGGGRGANATATTATSAPSAELEMMMLAGVLDGGAATAMAAATSAELGPRSASASGGGGGLGRLLGDAHVAS